MNKPSKAQLVARNNYFETSLALLLEHLKEATSADDISVSVSQILDNAPSLDPRPKAVVTEKVAINADDLKGTFIDPEAPADV